MVFRTAGLGILVLLAAAVHGQAQPAESAPSSPAARSFVSLPVSERLIGTWQLREHTEQERFYIRADGTFEWTMPANDAHVTLAGEWDLSDRTMIMIYGGANLRITAGRVDAVTPNYLAFNYANQKLMFERVTTSRSTEAERDAAAPDE